MFAGRFCRSGGASAALLMAVVLLWALPVAALADEAEQIYRAGAMIEIDLALSPEAEAALEAEPGEDVVAKVTVRLTDGTPDGATTTLTADHPVEVRLKGHKAGSFRPLSGKAAFKLKFKKSERFLGLRKMTLNNMVEDASMVHEALAYGLFRAAGVPASRTGYAYLRVNGEDFGVYLDVENVDETFLAAHYGAGNTLHLYEGEYGADVDAAGLATLDADVAEGDPKFEIDEGEGEPTDLQALANAVAGGPLSFSDRLSALADLDEMTRMWGVEKYVSHWDGYSGEEADAKPNNYYLLSDLAGRFQMLPWGTDNTWQVQRRVAFGGPGGLLFNGCLADPVCFRGYYNALESLRGQVAMLAPDAFAASAAALLKPWQELEEDESTRGEHSGAEIEAAVAKARQYIAQRPGELSTWLAANEPPLEAQPGSPAPSPVRGASAGPRMRVVGLARYHGRLSLRVRLSAPGRLHASVTIETEEGRRRVCVPGVATDTAAVVVLPCRFPAWVQRRLRQHQLRMRAVLRFTGLSGALKTTVRQVRMPRG